MVTMDLKAGYWVLLAPLALLCFSMISTEGPEALVVMG